MRAWLHCILGYRHPKKRDYAMRIPVMASGNSPSDDESCWLVAFLLAI